MDEEVRRRNLSMQEACFVIIGQELSEFELNRVAVVLLETRGVELLCNHGLSKKKPCDDGVTEHLQEGRRMEGCVANVSLHHALTKPHGCGRECVPSFGDRGYLIGEGAIAPGPIVVSWPMTGRPR